MSRQPSFTPYPSYLDAKAAIAFRGAAFGFETEIMVLGPGAVVREEAP